MIVIKKNYYKNNNLILSVNTTLALRNITRTKNYIAKSVYEGDSYFRGRIYSIKITDSNGNIILDFDVNKLFK